MTKHFCDRCGDEIGPPGSMKLTVEPKGSASGVFQILAMDLCMACADGFGQYVRQTKE